MFCLFGTNLEGQKLLPAVPGSLCCLLDTRVGCELLPQSESHLNCIGERSLRDLTFALPGFHLFLIQGLLFPLGNSLPREMRGQGVLVSADIRGLTSCLDLYHTILYQSQFSFLIVSYLTITRPALTCLAPSRTAPSEVAPSPSGNYEHRNSPVRGSTSHSFRSQKAWTVSSCISQSVHLCV